jgi:hypothetical protein
MVDIEELARREGESLARAILRLKQARGDPVPRDWPGSMNAAYLVASSLAVDPTELDQLARRIDEYGSKTWGVITHPS